MRNLKIYFKMKPILNKIFFLLLLLNVFSSLSQEKKNYRLIKIHSNVYIFNAIIYEGKILFGSDEGVLSIDKNIIYIENDNIIGPIEIVEGKIEKAQNIKYDNSFNYLLPDARKNLFSSHININNTLYLINSGDLLVYNRKFQKLKNYPSIRSISQNYIGTYGGIFYKDSIKLNFPTFTNGAIREYDSITIINWGGLSLIKADEQENYYSHVYSESGIKINERSYGEAIDSYELKHPHYYLSTSEGLYLFNSDSKEIKLLKKTQNGPYRFISGERNIYGLQLLYFHDRKNIIEFEIEKNLFNEIINRDEIIDVFSEEQYEYYVLTENRLEYFNRKTNKKNKIILKNLSNPNNVSLIKNFIITTTNQGVFLYDMISDKLTKNILKDELNYNAIFIEDKNIKLGGINGMYEFSYDDLMFFNNKTILDIPEKKTEYSIYLTFSLTILILALIIVFLIRKYRASYILINKQSIELSEKNIELSEKIIAFIKLNIAHVSVSLLCEEFKLTVNLLYNILGNKKPGEIIRKERLKIVKKMRRQKVSEEIISKATGFSISYLKKI